MHIIRLRGPWQLEPVARFVPQADGPYCPVTEGLPPAARVNIPADWSSAYGPEFLGRVKYHRSFNTPTGLESGHKVFLVVEAPRSMARVVLSGNLVGFVSSTEGAPRFNITDRLQVHNRLEIFVDHPALDELRSTAGDPATLLPGGLTGEVRLEIEE